jgi:hypothetical protein
LADVKAPSVKKQKPYTIKFAVCLAYSRGIIS